MCRQAGIVGWHLDRLERARPNRLLAAGSGRVIGSTAPG